MVQESAPRFRIRLRGYDRDPVDAEFAAIESDTAAARAEHDAALVRIRAAAAEVGRAYARLEEYRWLHAENPSREPLACYTKHLEFTATCEARAIVEQGERAFAGRTAW